jgi:hypothetical protein
MNHFKFYRESLIVSVNGETQSLHYAFSYEVRVKKGLNTFRMRAAKETASFKEGEGQIHRAVNCKGASSVC